MNITRRSVLSAAAGAVITPVVASPATALSSAVPDWAAFDRAVTGPVHRPGSTGYASGKLIFNTRYDGATALAVVRLTWQADIQQRAERLGSLAADHITRPLGEHQRERTGQRRRVDLCARLHRSGGRTSCGVRAHLGDRYPSELLVLSPDVIPRSSTLVRWWDDVASSGLGGRFRRPAADEHGRRDRAAGHVACSVPGRGTGRGHH